MGAIAIDPAAAPPRVPLFQAQVVAGRPQLAITALMPLLEPTGLSQYFDREPQAPPGTNVETFAPGFLADVGLELRERARTAEVLGGALSRLEGWTAAATAYRIAAALEPDAAGKAQIERSLAVVEQRRALELDNARRRPLVADQVEQAYTVRPRLTGVAQ
jgi:hypothetical protein